MEFGDWAGAQGIDLGGLNTDQMAGLGASYMNLRELGGTNGLAASIVPLQNTGGYFSGVQKSLNNVGKWASSDEGKGLISLAKIVGGTAGDIYGVKQQGEMIDAYKKGLASEEAERQRQVAKEELATSNADRLYNEAFRKKRVLG